MTENSETICAFTISLEHKTTYAHFHMFFFPHEENISSKPGFSGTRGGLFWFRNFVGFICHLEDLLVYMIRF